jgi:hypothetical protein
MFYLVKNACVQKWNVFCSTEAPLRDFLRLAVISREITAISREIIWPKSKTNKSVCPKLTEVGEMYESDCSQAGDWNCISPGYVEALIYVLSDKGRMFTKVECDWLYGGTIKRFPRRPFLFL